MSTGAVSTAEFQEIVSQVVSRKSEWASLPVAEKIKIIEEMIEIAKKEAQFIHDQSALIRGVDLSNSEHDVTNCHSWATGLVPWAGWLSETLIVFEHIRRTGFLPKPQKIETRPNGQIACKVGPSDLITWLFCGTPSYEVILDKDVSPRQPVTPFTRPAGCVGILGAGNYDAPIDIVSALFINNKVAVYKPNPVGGQYIANVVRTLCRPLIERGYLAIVEGGGDIGKAILAHEDVDEWYVTGSKQTFNAIMWSNPEGPQSEEQKPNISKPCVAELGGCSPVIIAPSRWNFLEMNLQVGHLSVFTTINGGHICVRPQAIVTCKNWPQREEFISKLKAKLERQPAYRSFYPGAFNKCKQFADLLKSEGLNEADFILHEPASLKAYGDGRLDDNGGVELASRVLTGAGKSERRHPMIFATGLKEDSKAFEEEAFCPVLLEICLDTAADYDSFLAAATKFSNDRLTGNLTATIVAKEPKHPAVARAVDALKHGIVGVNVNGVNAIVQPALFWGGGRGSSIRDVQSGVGLFGNLYCLDRPVKALVSAPFTNLAVLAQQATDYPKTQPIKLFKRLAFLMLNRRYSFNPFKFLYWTLAVSFALFNI